jgi:hypothetical protein
LVPAFISPVPTSEAAGFPSRIFGERARIEGVMIKPPQDSGYPVGYWAFLQDPDGHTLELSYGQEIGQTVENSI